MLISPISKINFGQILNDVSFNPNGQEMTITGEVIRQEDIFYIQDADGKIMPFEFAKALIVDERSTLAGVKEFVPSQMPSHPPINIFGWDRREASKQFALCLRRDSMSSPNIQVFSRKGLVELMKSAIDAIARV